MHTRARTLPLRYQHRAVPHPTRPGQRARQHPPHPCEFTTPKRPQQRACLQVRTPLLLSAHRPHPCPSRASMARQGTPPGRAWRHTLWQNTATRPKMMSQMMGHSCVLVSHASLLPFPNQPPPSFFCLCSARCMPRYLQPQRVSACTHVSGRQMCVCVRMLCVCVCINAFVCMHAQVPAAASSVL